MIDAIIPTKSAKSPTFTAYLIFLIPTAPKYTVNMYKVVSVLPCIVDASLPIKESGPCVAINSEVTPKAAFPEMGLTSANGTISGGIPIAVSMGAIKPIDASKAPELLKIEMATNIPTKKGSKENAN